MFKASVLAQIHQHYPQVQVRYKNQSLIMKLWSWILKVFFHNTFFMTLETDKIGNRIYFPNECFIARKPITALIMLLHETTYVHYDYRFLKLLHRYLPWLIIPVLLLCFFSWKLTLIILLVISIFSYDVFRLYRQKLGCLSSLYCMHALNNKHNYHIDLHAQGSFLLTQFSGPTYYLIKPLMHLDKEFDQAIVIIESNRRPYPDTFFDVLDSIIDKT